MGIMVHSLLWVIQDLYHQPHKETKKELQWSLWVDPEVQPWASKDVIIGSFRGLGPYP